MLVIVMAVMSVPMVVIAMTMLGSVVCWMRVRMVILAAFAMGMPVATVAGRGLGVTLVLVCVLMLSAIVVRGPVMALMWVRVATLVAVLAACHRMASVRVVMAIGHEVRVRA